MSLTEAQIFAIDITEKTGSALSVVGEAFVVTTFLFGSKFRKPINRMVFYAAWGNIFSSIATLIGRTGIKTGLHSPLCQFQALVIQWFMPADAIWTFAMACNVWLSFFHHYDAPKLRSLEWRYILLCYGLPFPSALIFLFISTQVRGNVYGDAVLWCWISIGWDYLRIGVFYAPVWIIILLTIAIYLRVGLVIWRWRRQILSLGRRAEHQMQRGSTEASTPEYDAARMEELTVTTATGTIEDKPAHTRHSSADMRSDGLEKRQSSRMRDRVRSTATDNRTKSRRGTFRHAGSHANKAAIKYCKCALLFFIALLVTWVPSTINRIYTVFYPDEVVFGLQFAAALVLPLQGFWNCVVYIVTSNFACRCLLKDIHTALRSRKDSIAESLPGWWYTHAFQSHTDSERDPRESAASDVRSLKPTQHSP